MRKLDVKEIHGYNNVQGLKLVRAEALARFVDQNKSAKSTFRSAAE
jgi:arginine decarboxylase